MLFGADMLAFRQEENKEAEDCFRNRLKSHANQTIRRLTVRSLTGLARAALRESNYAKAMSEEAGTIARNMGNEYLETLPPHMLAAATKMEGDLKSSKQLYEESLAWPVGSATRAMESTEPYNLGSVSLHMGELKRAKEWYRQAGELIYKIPDVPLHFSMVALEEGKLDRPVKLLRASEALFESSGMSADPDESVERDRTVSRLRKAIDESKFNGLWTEGTTLSLD